MLFSSLPFLRGFEICGSSNWITPHATLRTVVEVQSWWHFWLNFEATAFCYIWFTSCDKLFWYWKQIQQRLDKITLFSILRHSQSQNQKEQNKRPSSNQDLHSSLAILLLWSELWKGFQRMPTGKRAEPLAVGLCEIQQIPLANI